MIVAEAVVTFSVPDGFRVIRRLGTASGQGFAPRNPLRTTLRTIGALIGFAPQDYLSDAERARTESLVDLLARAEAMGANGILKLQFDACELLDGSTQVMATGEAVVLEPQPGSYEGSV